METYKICCAGVLQGLQWNGQKSSDLGRNNVMNIYSEDYFKYIGVFISYHISQI